MEYYGDTLEQAVSAAVNREKKNSNRLRLDAVPFWSPWIPLIPNVRLRPSNTNNPMATVRVYYEAITGARDDFEIEIRTSHGTSYDRGNGSKSFDVTLDSVETMAVRVRTEDTRQEVLIEAEAF